MGEEARNSGAESGARPDHFAVVGVGASAGGLEAFTELLRRIPADTGLAFVLVQHLDPHHGSLLSELLARETEMPVRQVTSETTVERNHVYVIPPNFGMVISNRVLGLHPRAADLSQHLPIDAFLASLALDLGANAIGVILSGTGNDGTAGLKAIKAEGGITFVQDQSAKFDSMPRNAAAAGVVDFMLPPARIAEEIASIAKHPYRNGSPQSEMLSGSPQMQRVMLMLRSSFGVDFTQYKQPTVMRRLARRMVMRKAERLEEYLGILHDDQSETKALFDDLLINVTDFFRNPAVMEAAQRVALPKLIADRKTSETIRVWIPGCSTGEEVYSLAIALSEFLENRGADFTLQLFGTDISEAAVDKARHGVYDESAMANVSAERRRRFFGRANSGYQINRTIRDMCIFSRHNVAKDPPLSRMDIISCRNLLIYFTPALQKRVISTFGYALNPGGCLILGNSESLGPMGHFFTALDEEHRIYCKKANLTAASFELADRIGAGDLEQPDLRVAVANPKPPLDGIQAGLIEALKATEPSLAQTDRPAGPDRKAEVLEQELTATRQYLQSIIEELRSTNEEAQSANEELHSTNEELQTAKEELQSSNEELNTINAEMQSRNSELAQANDDLLNLLTSMNMPVVMMGNDLCIRRFTPVAAKVLHMIPADVGRPISDLKPRINIPDLDQILLRVLETLAPDEREVQDLEGRWYLMRIRPYRTSDNRIDGAVLQLLDLGELKKSLDDLKKARDYAQAIVDTVREPLVVLDSHCAIRNANRAFYDFAQMNAAGAQGQLVFEIANRSLDTPAVHRMLAKLEAGETHIQDVEVEYRSGGAERVILVNARYLRDEGHSGLILLAFEDITDRKREAEARYRRLFESAHDGIIILDAASGDVSDLNPYFEHISGYRREELVNRKVWDIEPLRNQPGIRAALEETADRGVFTIPEVAIQTRDGRALMTEVIANVYADGDRRAIQLNVRDLTERKKFERELRHTAKLESLGLLAGGIAHDFNNLLTGILGNASLVYSEMPVDNISRRYLREVVNASERAAFLTKQLLAYAGQGRFTMENVHLGELVREIALLISTSIPKTVEVRLSLPDDLPPVYGDPGQIQQVVMNLVINGAEAIGENRTGRVDIATDIHELNEDDARTNFSAEDLAPGRYIRLGVRDNGSGMDEATKARIFDPFFTTKFTGRGLGLAAVMGIVRAHKGAIRVYSAPGHGTSFHVLFPVAAGVAAAGSAAPAQQAAHFEGVALVIDDEPIVRDLAVEVLTRNGFKTLSASNGQEGVDIFRRNKDSVKVVLLDLTMPVMNGEEALEALRAIRPDVRVIISSGLDASDAAAGFSGEKPNAFLQKPYRTDALVETVRNALRGVSDGSRPD